MLDLKFIRANADLVKDGARKKHIACDVDRILELDGKVRTLQTEAQAKKAEQNAASKRIATLSGDEKGEAIATMKSLAAAQKEADRQAKEFQEELDGLMMHVPNPPAPEVPEGKDDTEKRRTAPCR